MSEYEDLYVDLDKVQGKLLSNTFEWREEAAHFEKYGYYTKHPKSLDPNSKYYKYWVEQGRRCVYGYTTPSGVFLSGYYYFYLNFSQIKKVVFADKDDVVGVEIFGFPDVWDIDFEYFTLIEQAETDGKHVVVLKTRRRGFSFKGASMMCRNYFLLPKSNSYAFAYEKDYLIDADGLLSKAWEIMNFIDNHTGWARRRQYTNTGMIKRASYEKDAGGFKVEEGYRSNIIGVSLKGNVDRVRGKRGKLLLFEESGKNPYLKQAWRLALSTAKQGRHVFGLLIAFGCVCAGTKVWTKNGSLINIEDLKQNDGILGYNGNFASLEDITYMQEIIMKPCYRITTNTGRYLECSDDHPILTFIGMGYPKKVRQHIYRPKGLKREPRTLIVKTDFIETRKLKIDDRIAIIDKVSIFGEREMWEPRLIGWLIGDGTYGHDHSPRMANCEPEINSVLESKFDAKVTRQYKTKDGKDYKEIRLKGICHKLRELGIYGQTKLAKTLPIDIHSYRKEDVCELLGGLFDTDGYVSVRYNAKYSPAINISIASASKELLTEIMFLLHKLGIHGIINRIKMSKTNPKDKNDHYRLTIADQESVLRFNENITLYPKVKNERLTSTPQIFKNKRKKIQKSLSGIKLERITNIEYLGLKEVYNLTANNTHTYIANGIVTHNTGGTEGGDFEGLEDMFIHPKKYDIFPCKNIWEPTNMGEDCGFFAPEYKGRSGYIDKDGNSDITGALAEIKQNRQDKIDQNSTPEEIARNQAEEAIYPSEAMMNIGDNMFPVADLRKRRAEVESQPTKYYETFWRGDLVIDGEGSIRFEVDVKKHPIWEYPFYGKNTSGCVIIYEQPVKQNGEIPYGMYIAGTDPYNHVHGTSLGSTFILNRVTDRIVAEYTGRPLTDEMYYENVRRLLLYFNARCNYENSSTGMFTYMNRMNCSWVLTDTPSVLYDKIHDKGTLERGKGTPPTEKINKYARERILAWLMTKIVDIKDPDSKDERVGLLNLHKICSVPLLKELEMWNKEGNFDRVSALGMLMIQREEDYHIFVDPSKQPKAVDQDEFWKRSMGIKPKNDIM